MHIYLDESGDLGFNFDDKKPSRHFIITLLVCNDRLSDNTIKKAVNNTLKNKLHTKNKRKHLQELKGTQTTTPIKTYFFKQAAKNNSWKIYCIILDKKLILEKLPTPIDTHRLYNIIANHLLKQVNFSEAIKVNLIIDKSKNRSGIGEFDAMLRASLNTTLPYSVKLQITHASSHTSYGIQAVDLFCWGIFRNYERNDEEWYKEFKSRIIYEQRFLA